MEWLSPADLLFSTLVVSGVLAEVLERRKQRRGQRRTVPAPREGTTAGTVLAPDPTGGAPHRGVRARSAGPVGA